MEFAGSGTVWMEGGGGCLVGMEGRGGGKGVVEMFWRTGILEGVKDIVLV
jgi:hypothetical protein